MTASEKQKISTFVFLDLEATGCNTPGSRNKITEICMVAVHRSTLSDPCEAGIPRVMNKLCVAVYPMKAICGEITEITGLDNTNLYCQKDFDGDLGNLIKLFLMRLDPPVCFVAHHGSGFDFPLLRTELHRVGIMLPNEILSADSLIAIKALDAEDCHTDIQSHLEETPKKRFHVLSAETLILKRKPETNENGKHVKLQKSESGVQRALFKEFDQSSGDDVGDGNGDSSAITSQDNDKLVSDKSLKQCLGDLTGVLDNDESDPEYWDDNAGKNSLQYTSANRSPKTLSKDLSETCENTKDPIKVEGNSGDICEHDDCNQVRHCSVDDNHLGAVSFSQKQAPSSNIQAPSSNIHSFASTSQSSISQHTKKLINFNELNTVSYKQAEIYKRYFGSYPTVSHFAEHDCYTLLKIAQKISSKFCEWCDCNAIPFNTSQILYEVSNPKLLPRGTFPYK